jgi:PAS domain S-box-containing protein
MTPTAVPARLSSPELPDCLATDILKSWKDPILVLDSELRIIFANRCFCDWVGESPLDLDQVCLDHVLRGPQVLEFARAAQLGSPVRDLQANCDVAGLGRRALLLNISHMGISPQRTLSLGVVDITDQQLSNSALTRNVQAAQRGEAWQRQETELLRSIMESSGDGIFVSDADGDCVLWNPACERMLGVQPSGVRLDQWVDDFGLFLPDKETPFATKDLPLSRALNGESCDEVEVWVRNRMRPAGLWISVTARPLTGAHRGAVAAFRDITFAKEAKATLAALAEEAARSNQELELFAYVAAHDLQEPLRTVSSYVSLLARRYQGKLDPEADEFIRYATDGAKRMSLLINDLLTYSRVGQAAAIETLVDCEKVLEQVLHSLGRKNLLSEAEFTHDSLPQIKANELQITQVFQNLIDNAVKFRGKESPKVHISALAEGKQWIFSVADNGIGIDVQYKDRVFVIFQRLHSREDYPGTGIGLAICKKIVEQREGRIWVGPNQGTGTIVYFTWPQTGAAEERTLHA